MMERILLGMYLSNFLFGHVQTGPLPRRKNTEESFIVRYLEEGRIVPVKVELNAKRQTEHIVSSVGGETLYDFNQRKVAYKDSNSSQCFIADIAEESFEGDRERLRNLQNGVIRGFYLPTFLVQEEFGEGAPLSDTFGDLLTHFCRGHAVSSVARQQHRGRREAGGRGQFTHHSYGHYGHQSNNYAHYGHETHVAGSLDENGRPQNQRVSHQQVRSESTEGYPDPSFRNAPSVLTTDPRTGITHPQSQTQYQMPSYGQNLGGRQFGIGSSGQFALQTAQESGYQLNLPLGLKAGNAYRGGIRSAGHYGVGGLQPQITTEYQRYPDSSHSARDQSNLSQVSPPVSAVPYPSATRIQPGATPVDQMLVRPGTTVSGYRHLDGRNQTDLERIPTAFRPGIQTPISSTTVSERRFEIPTAARGREASGIQTDSRTFHTGSSSPGIQTSVFQPGISMPSVYAPGSRAQTPLALPQETPLRVTGTESRITGQDVQTPGYRPSTLSLPGQISRTETPGTHTVAMRPGTSIPQPSYHTPSIHQDFRYQPPTLPRGLTSQQHFVQTPSVSHPREHGTNGEGATRSQVPFQYPSTTFTGYPGSDLTYISPPGSTIPGADSTSPGVSRTDQTSRSGLQYPSSIYNGQTQRGYRDQYPGGGISPRESDISRDSSGRPIVRPGERQFLPTETGPIPPGSTRGYQQPVTFRQEGTALQPSARDMQIPSRYAPGSVQSGDRRITDSVGYGSSRAQGQDSAASQTQIQTNVAGTAAEASAAGQYRGLGSQTQVQGGYEGNGSFSAQAQSGFTGGVVQSQVQGSKQGGLSGSSAQVERVGSAQSQVQVGQPSGAASSSAQGRFSGGITQVQAQSGRSGGSAGAQAQSVGLSSSHVQVNVGGNDVREQERFQGTVSASVQGGHSSGQSQTQMQGGYESGRTYVATAQGGFDTSSGLQVSVPQEGSLPRFLDQTVGTGQPTSVVRDQRPDPTIRGIPDVNSQTYKIPAKSVIGDMLTPQTTQIHPGDQTAGRTIYTPPSGAVPDQRHMQAGRPQQIPFTATPGQSLVPPSSIRDSGTQYPTMISGVQRPVQVIPPFKPGAHSDHITSTTDRKQIPGSQPRFPDYSRQGGIISSGVPGGTQQASASRTPDYRVRGIQPPGLPGQLSVREGPHYVSGSKADAEQDLSHPLPFAPSFPHTTHQQHNYTAGIPLSYPQYPEKQPGASIFPQTPDSPTFGSGYVPSYSQGLIPTLQRPVDPMTGFQPSSLPGIQTPPYPSTSFFPGQQTLQPGSQTAPSHTRPDDMSTATRVAESHRFGLQPSSVPSLQPPAMQPPIRPQMTRFQPSPLPGIQTLHYPPASFFPGQQTLQPGSQTAPSHTHPDDMLTPTRVAESHRFGLQPISVPSLQPSAVQPPITQQVTVPRVPSQTVTTDAPQTSPPGVLEPDTKNCCEALRDLQRRCCGRTSKQNGASSCCQSTRDDIFDFSTDDELDENKQNEPCKIVKAICYIVYRPVGKARICKPTQTNGC